MTRMTQMTHCWLDTPLHELNDNALMQLKLELLRKVKAIENEMTLREVATGVQ